MIIAIDGPAGSGKSTIAKILAESLNIVFLNTGSFYRGLTLALLRFLGGDSFGRGGKDIDLSNEKEIIDFAKTIKLDYVNGAMTLDSENIEAFLRSDRVESFVAPISAIVPIRHIINDKIREVAKNVSLVCEGRDMTTVVFPDAEYKFYLDASSHARALRRFNQGTSTLSLQEIEKSIEARDAIDKNKAEGSLKIAQDAQYIDTSDLTIDAVCEMIKSKIYI